MCVCVAQGKQLQTSLSDSSTHTHILGSMALEHAVVVEKGENRLHAAGRFAFRFRQNAFAGALFARVVVADHQWQKGGGVNPPYCPLFHSTVVDGHERYSIRFRKVQLQKCKTCAPYTLADGVFGSVGGVCLCVWLYCTGVHFLFAVNQLYPSRPPLSPADICGKDPIQNFAQERESGALNCASRVSRGGGPGRSVTLVVGLHLSRRCCSVATAPLHPIPVVCPPCPSNWRVLLFVCFFLCVLAPILDYKCSDDYGNSLGVCVPVCECVCAFALLRIAVRQWWILVFCSAGTEREGRGTLFCSRFDSVLGVGMRLRLKR